MQRQLNSPCQEVCFIFPFVVIDPTDLGVTKVVKLLQPPGLKLDSFLPIPAGDAESESLPFYPSVS